MTIIKSNKNIYITGLLLLLSIHLFSQFTTCDTTLINAHLNPAGYTRLYVPTQLCSMYFYNPTPMYGIDAHRNALNLGVPGVIIDNAQENTDLNNALHAQGVFPTNNEIWLGMTDSPTVYNWHTYSGATPSYYNWLGGEPNNASPTCKVLGSCAFCTGADAYWCAHGEDCAVMNDGGQWLDITCQGNNIKHIAVLELNTCPVISPPRDTAICSGNPVHESATVISGGTPSYTYTWTPGPLTGQTVTLSPTSTTTYTISASDHYSCKADTTFTISVTSTTPPTITPASATPCKGVNDNISLSTVSGTATYTWSFGAGASVVSGSGGGPYVIDWTNGGTKTINVTVSDQGCTTQATTTVTVDSAIAAFTLNPTSTCVNQNVTVTVPSPSGTANYAWSFSGANVVSGTGAGPYTIDWTSPGTEPVTLTVTDHGCTATATANESVSAGITPAFTLNPSTTACPGQPVSVSITGTVSGSATYIWSFGGGTVLSGSGAGPYSVSWNTIGTQTVDLTVSDGCIGSTSQSININNSIIVNGGPDVQLCPGAMNVLGGTPTASGGSGPYTYSWSPAVGLSSTTVANPIISFPTNPFGRTVDTFYVLTVTSGFCTATDTVKVTLYPNINNNFTLSSNSACINNDVTVTYSGTPSGTAIYNWNFGSANIVSGSGVGPYVVNWSSPGTEPITLSVSDNGCTATPVTNNVNVSNGLMPTFTLNPSTTACPGQQITVTLTSSQSGTATYNWNFNGATVQSGSGPGPYSISWNTQGTQTVDLTVTDGCVGTTSQSVNINNSLVADAGADIQLCPGVQGTLGVAPTAGYSYSWTPAWGLSSATVADPTIIPSNPTGATIDTFYVLTVTSGTCSATDTVDVTIYPDINNNFIVSSSTVCIGANVTITYSGTPSGTASYNWNFGSANVVSGSSAGPYVLNWSSSGAQPITLDVTDNGCTGTQGSTTVNVGAPVTADAGSDATVCSGTIVSLGAAPASGVNYSWTPAINLSNASISDPTFQETNNGSSAIPNPYMLIADAGGCPDTAYVTITVKPATTITISASGATSFCQGDSTTLQVSGGPFVSYLWFSTDTTSSITVKTAGTYSVTATDPNGCEDISNPAITIAIFPTPAVSLAPNGEIDETCWNADNGSLTVQGSNGTPNYSFVWNTTPAQSGPTASHLAPGSYTVTITDANGCIDSGSFSVLPATYLGIVIDSSYNVSCYGKADGAIYADGTGGALPYSYLWSTGATTSAVTNLKADSISVILTDANGCSIDTSILITQPGPITITPTGTWEVSLGQSQQLEVSVSPASSYYYAWSTGATLSCTNCPDPVATPLQTTAYLLTVTDATSGCQDTITLTLTVDASKHVYVPNAFTPNGDGVNDVFYVYSYGGARYFEIEIFDRWGEQVYRSNDLTEGWDGTYRGQNAAGGNYVYQIILTYPDGQSVKNKGSIILLR